MVFLLFRMGNDRYALETACVAKILPMVRLKQIPQAPPGVAGLLDLHGTPVPIIDLTLLALGRPARAMMSTRIVLVHYRVRYGFERPNGMRLLGLIVEQATETLRREAADFVAVGVRSDGTPYLGPVTRDAQGLVQRITVDRLLTPAMHDVLFQEAETA